MKSALKALLPLALCAATSAYAINNDCGGHGQSSYYFDSVTKGTKVKITLQGAGTKDLAKLLQQVSPDSSLVIGQYFDLKSDCTFVSGIYGRNQDGQENLYTITGTWSYPAESKAIYFALDGDISQGSNVADPDETTWGRLLAGGLSIPNVMPLIFGDKISSFVGIFPSFTTKTATIVPGKNGKAKATMSITGKGISTDLKKGTKKEASFSFTSTVSAQEIH